MPYHCEELANRADLVPLAGALADMQGTDVSKCGSTMVSRRKPKASRRPPNSLSSSSDPAVLGAIGAFGTAAFSVFGKKFSTWFWDYLWHCWGQSKRTAVTDQRNLSLTPG
jgi:hypothetical protein